MIEFEPVWYQIRFWSGIVDLNVWARASLVSDRILIWHCRSKCLSSSQFGIRSHFDLALLPKQLSLSQFNIKSGFDLALYVEEFKIEPVCCQIVFWCGTKNLNDWVQAISVSDRILIWGYRSIRLGLSWFYIWLGFDLALYLEKFKLEPVQYLIWFWSGILHLNDWAWARLVLDLILIWRYRPKQMSLRHFNVRSGFDLALYVKKFKFESVRYLIWFWSDIADLNDWVWASLASDRILIWRDRPKRFSLSQFNLRSGFDLVLYVEVLKLKPVRYLIWFRSDVVDLNDWVGASLA